MNSEHEVYYYLAPGVDVAPLHGGGILFRSDTLTIHIEGDFSTVFFERVLPLLDEQHSFSEIVAKLPDIDADDLWHHLNTLAQARALHSVESPHEPQEIAGQVLAPFLAILDDLGIR